MSTRTNSQFVAASVKEFLSVWCLGGEASLNLITRNGQTEFNIYCTLGHPCAPHSLLPSLTPSPTPAPPPLRPCHRGPSERQCAARHQEARTAASASTSTLSSSVTVSVTNLSSPSPVKQISLVWSWPTLLQWFQQVWIKLFKYVRRELAEKLFSVTNVILLLVLWMELKSTRPETWGVSPWVAQQIAHLEPSQRAKRRWDWNNKLSRKHLSHWIPEKGRN